MARARSTPGPRALEESAMNEAPRFFSHQEILELNLPLEEAFSQVERALIEHARGQVEMPPKPGVHPQPDSFIHAMPAFVPALNACGMKWVSGYPDNAKRGLPTIDGMLVLNDPQTGRVLACLDAAWITALRTAIVSALIVRVCAREDATSLGLAGCGVQGQYHLRCLCHVRPELKKVRLYDIRKDSAARLRREAEEYTGADLEIVDHPEACLRDADIAVTCTSGNVLDVPASWVPHGGTAVGVDSHVAWTQLFSKVQKFVLDDTQQARAFEKKGKYRGPLPAIHAEIGQILSGDKPGRSDSDERILGLPLGLAITDVALGKLLLDKFM